jgi:hypothetical protein
MGGGEELDGGAFEGAPLNINRSIYKEQCYTFELFWVDSALSYDLLEFNRS